MNKRLTTYSTVATELALLSDQRLTELLKNATPISDLAARIADVENTLKQRTKKL